jgi:hypothetical protein
MLPALLLLTASASEPPARAWREIVTGAARCEFRAVDAQPLVEALRKGEDESPWAAWAMPWPELWETLRFTTSLPGRGPRPGGVHVLAQVRCEVDHASWGVVEELFHQGHMSAYHSVFEFEHCLSGPPATPAGDLVPGFTEALLAQERPDASFGQPALRSLEAGARRFLQDAAKAPKARAAIGDRTVAAWLHEQPAPAAEDSWVGTFTQVVRTNLRGDDLRLSPIGMLAARPQTPLQMIFAQSAWLSADAQHGVVWWLPIAGSPAPRDLRVMHGMYAWSAGCAARPAPCGTLDLQWMVEVPRLREGFSWALHKSYGAKPEDRPAGAIEGWGEEIVRRALGMVDAVRGGLLYGECAPELGRPTSIQPEDQPGPH